MKLKSVCTAQVLLFLLFTNPLVGFASALANVPDAPQSYKIIAKKYEFVPREIIVKKDQPAVLELSSLDRTHGFNAPDLKLHATIEPGKTVQVKFTPDKTGEFAFFCDVFCGAGHEDMSGKIRVIQ